jgi:tetratricopeptide (TPR) repeat protein
LTTRLETSPSYPDFDEPLELDHTDWHPHRRSEPGAVRRRFHARRARQMQAEAGYVWLHDAMLARELTDREEAVREMERAVDAARLERLAEHSPQRTTRRSALNALARLKAVPALESAALYIRPEVFTPKKTKPTGEEEGATRAKAPEFHDDTRDLAIDLLAQLAAEDNEDALAALKRIVRYDFSPDAGARFRAMRRLSERTETLESRKDWDTLSMLYRESRSANTRRDVAERLSRYLDELEAAGDVDSLLAVADVRADLRDEAEAAVRRIEGT